MPIDDTEQFTVEMGGTTASSRVQKMLIAYSGTMNNDANRHFAADNYDLVDCNPGVSATQEMPERNPSLILIGYRYLPNTLDWTNDWSDINLNHEDWFAHITGDPTATGRIWSQTDQGKEYLMKPYNIGWRQHHIQRTMDYMNNYPWYDGIFMDDTMANFQLFYSYYNWNHTYAQVESEMKNPAPQTGWQQGTYDLINQTQQALGTRMLMPNSGSATEYCQNYTHVHFYEHFVHKRTDGYDAGSGNSGYMPWMNRQGSSAYYLNAINYLHTQAALGNKIAVNSGCSPSATFNQRQTVMGYCLAAFLMVCGTDIRNLYFSWCFMGQETFNDILNMYIPMVETEFGQPITDYSGDIRNTSFNVHNHPLCPSNVPDWYDCGYSDDDPAVANTWNGTWHRCNYSYCGGVFLREFENYYVAVNIAPSRHTGYDYTFTSGPLAGQTITARTGLFIQKV